MSHLHAFKDLLMVSTVEPPIRDFPKCQAWVVTYGRWSLMRAWIILGQNLATLAFGNCRDLPYGLIFLFTQKVNCEKKIITSP